ncbi:MAG: hypothetical protein PHD51_03685 [Patescibacteria group bacterium]|nr:hypothetical protein [Patescibacteria group bacterium]MDD5490925.1 hypothetical protein [Patescibacteria group bacterium]
MKKKNLFQRFFLELAAAPFGYPISIGIIGALIWVCSAIFWCDFGNLINRSLFFWGLIIDGGAVCVLWMVYIFLRAGGYIVKCQDICLCGEENIYFQVDKCGKVQETGDVLWNKKGYGLYEVSVLRGSKKERGKEYKTSVEISGTSEYISVKWLFEWTISTNDKFNFQEIWDFLKIYQKDKIEAGEIPSMGEALRNIFKEEIKKKEESIKKLADDDTLIEPGLNKMFLQKKIFSLIEIPKLPFSNIKETELTVLGSEITVSKKSK